MAKKKELSKFQKRTALVAAVFMLGAAVCFAMCSLYHFGKIDTCPNNLGIAFAVVGIICFLISSVSKGKSSENNKK